MKYKEYSLTDQQSKKLQEHIAMPDWENRLRPLFLFKGTKPHYIRALFNVAYAMYLAECDSVFDGRKLIIPDGDHGRLCGLTRPAQHGGIRGIFSRMRACKQLTDSVSKSFTEYVEYIHPSPCMYDRVELETSWSGAGFWRVVVKKKRQAREYIEKTEEKCYPYFEAKTPDQQLISKVYSFIPKSIPPEIKSDLCQDLVVAILCGETTIENLERDMKKYITKARKFMPNRWRDVSIDQPVKGTDDLILGETLSDNIDYYEEIDFNKEFSESEDEDFMGFQHP